MSSPEIARARAYVEEVHYRFMARHVAEEPGLAANRIALISCDLHEMALRSRETISQSTDLIAKVDEALARGVYLF